SLTNPVLSVIALTGLYNLLVTPLLRSHHPSEYHEQALRCARRAHHLAFITSRMRSKSSREEYSIRILPLPLRSVMATRTPSARCSSCSASLTFGSTIRTFSALSGG